jgi:hypothetical protein
MDINSSSGPGFSPGAQRFYRVRRLRGARGGPGGGDDFMEAASGFTEGFRWRRSRGTLSKVPHADRLAPGRPETGLLLRLL